MRSITLAVLLAWCGAAVADQRIAADCAESVSGLAGPRAMAGAMDMEIASAQITDDQVARWYECRRVREDVASIARMRAEVDANQLRINRMLGRLQPGGGYHIVYFADGRVIRSAYFGGRQIR